MLNQTTPGNKRAFRQCILLAGTAGGLAEIIWVAVYSLSTPASGLEVARQVTATLIPAFAQPLAGVVIHLLLSLIVAAAFAILVWRPLTRHHGATVTLAGAVLALVMIWGVNFMVILPALNPTFVTLLPLPVSLISKVLYGLAMGWVFATYTPHVQGHVCGTAPVPEI